MQTATLLGQQITIVRGTLTGVTGKLINKSGSRFTIELGRGVLVRIEAADCDLIDGSLPFWDDSRFDFPLQYGRAFGQLAKDAIASSRAIAHRRSEREHLLACMGS